MAEFEGYSNSQIFWALHNSGLFEYEMRSRRCRFWNLRQTTKIVNTQQIVTKCRQCPNNYGGECQLNKEKIPDMDNIPVWCSL